MKSMSRFVAPYVVTMLVFFSLSISMSAKSVSFWTQSSTAPWLTQLIKDFTEETGIEVHVRQIGWTVEELYVAYAAGVMPDLFTHGGAALGTLAHQGLMRPLDDIVQTWDFADDIIPIVYDIARYEGKQVGMTWAGLSVGTLVYNADIFSQVGLNADEPPERWHDMVDIGRKLVRRDENGRILRSAVNVRDTGHAPSGSFRTFTLQSGLDPFGPELHSISLLDERIVTAVTFYADIFNNYRLTDRGFAGTLGNRTTVMSMDSPAPFVQFEEEAQNFKVALYPYNEVPFVSVTGDFISMASRSENPEAAKQFLEYILHPDRQYTITRERGFLPIFSQGIWWDWVQEVPAYHDFISLTMQYGKASTPHALFFELRDLQNEMMRRALVTDPRIVLEEENGRFKVLMSNE